jgi:MFS transporter, DHA3 family, macrolide efflux protein
MTSTTIPAAPLSFTDVLRIKVMRRVWLAQVVSVFGDFLALFAVISVVSFRMHGTPAQITWVQIAYMLPIALLGPIAGVFVDRWPLKPTLVVSDLIRAALAALLMIATELWHVYLILMAISCVSSAFAPAQTVTIRSHVPREGLLSANSLMQMAFMGMRIIGPATAGTLVATFGPEVCYTVDVASFLGSAALIGSVTIRRAILGETPGAPPSGRNTVSGLLHDMMEGFRFIGGHSAVLFVVVAMAAGLFTVGCFGPLIAIYVRDFLHAKEQLFGVISAMIGTGWIAGMPVLRSLSKSLSSATMVLLGLVAVGVGAALLGTLTFVPVAIAATFIIGVAVSAVIVPAQTLLQQETPPALVGRVSSTSMSVVFLGQVLGLAFSGVLANAFGVRLVFMLCAALAVVLAAGGKAFLHLGVRKSA